MKRLLLLVCGLLLQAAPLPGVAAVSVVDDMGRSVQLERPAQRIVSLAPHITEMLYDAGAGERVVAAVSYSNYPPAARELPRIGSHDRFDIERILAYDPDLIVGWQSGNPDESLERLLELGVPMYLSEPRSLDSIADNLERLGKLAGTAEAATAAARRFRERYDRLRQRYSERAPLTVFYEIWNEPLMTVNGEHLISAVVRACGGRNVFADLPTIAPRISVEAVLQRDPEVIIASGMDDRRPEWLDEWKRWPDLAAVERGNLFFIDPDLLQRHTVRVLDGMEQMCQALEEART